LGCPTRHDESKKPWYLSLEWKDNILTIFQNIFYLYYKLYI
jgi:hypothetical protein